MGWGMYIPITIEAAKNHIETVRYEIMQALCIYDYDKLESEADDVFKSAYPECYEAFCKYRNDFMRWHNETIRLINSGKIPDGCKQVELMELSEIKDRSSRELYDLHVKIKQRIK